MTAAGNIIVGLLLAGLGVWAWRLLRNGG